MLLQPFPSQNEEAAAKMSSASPQRALPRLTHLPQERCGSWQEQGPCSTEVEEVRAPWPDRRVNSVGKDGSGKKTTEKPGQAGCS